MNRNCRIVLDANVLLSAMLRAESIPRRAVNESRLHSMLISSETFHEIVEKVQKPKFDKYLSLEERFDFVEVYDRDCQPIEIVNR